MNYFCFSIFRSIIFILLVLGIIVNFTAPFFYFYLGTINVLFCIFSGIILLLTFINFAADNISECRDCMYFVIAIWSTIFVIIRRFAPSIEARNKENKVICEKILGRDASEDDIEFCTLKLTLLKLEVEFFLCIFVFFEFLLFWVIYRFYYEYKSETLTRDGCETPPSYGTINANVPNPNTRDDSTHDRVN